MKRVVLLGSTGSIGTSTIKVAEDLPDYIRLLGLGAGNNAELLLQQTLKFKPEAISIGDPEKARELENTLGTSTRVHAGEEGLLALATLPAADIVLIAIVGTAGLKPALAAIQAGFRQIPRKNSSTKIGTAATSVDSGKLPATGV